MNAFELSEVTMGIFLNIILLIIGFVGLVKGADFFVDESSALAQIFIRYLQ